MLPSIVRTLKMNQRIKGISAILMAEMPTIIEPPEEYELEEEFLREVETWEYYSGEEDDPWTELLRSKT